jgi:hypothetical protein
MMLLTTTLLSRSKKRRNLDFTWAGEPSPADTQGGSVGKRHHVRHVELVMEARHYLGGNPTGRGGIAGIR